MTYFFGFIIAGVAGWFLDHKNYGWAIFFSFQAFYFMSVAILESFLTHIMNKLTIQTIPLFPIVKDEDDNA